MINYMNLVEKEIKENEDLKYFEFSKKIIKETQIKVRSTKVKQIAKKYANTQIGKIFLTKENFSAINNLLFLAIMNFIFP